MAVVKSFLSLRKRDATHVTSIISRGFLPARLQSTQPAAPFKKQEGIRRDLYERNTKWMDSLKFHVYTKFFPGSVWCRKRAFAPNSMEQNVPRNFKWELIHIALRASDGDTFLEFFKIISHRRVLLFLYWNSLYVDIRREEFVCKFFSFFIVTGKYAPFLSTDKNFDKLYNPVRNFCASNIVQNRWINWKKKKKRDTVILERELI